MKKQAKPSWGAASVAILALGVAWSYLPMNSAYAKQPMKCNADAVSQSVCIYQAILADVDKTYLMRGGGGIGSIAGTSTWDYKVELLQEGRIDHVDYTVRIGAGGKVEIVDKKKSTETMGPPHTPLEFPISWSWAIAPIYHIFSPVHFPTPSFPRVFGGYPASFVIRSTWPFLPHMLWTVCRREAFAVKGKDAGFPPIKGMTGNSECKRLNQNNFNACVKNEG